jgi:O-antigen/teichoic acid export membrane protein
LLLLGLNTGFALRVVHLRGPAVRPAILTVLSFSTAISILGTLVILVAVDHGLFGSALSPLVPILIPLGLLAIGTTMREVASVFPQVRQDLRFIGRNSVLMDFGGALFAIALVLTGFGAYGALLGPAIMSLLGASIAASHSLRLAEGPSTLDRSFLTSVLRSALPVVPLALALWTLQSSDYFFVSYFRGTVALAIYGLAYNLASPALMAMAAMNLTFLPTCVEILGRGRSEFAHFIDNSTRLFAVAGVAAVAFSAVAGPAVTTWFAGPAYTESGRLLPVVVAAYALFSLAQLQQFVPGAMIQDLSGSARAHAWAAGFNVASNFIVVPRYGYWGAAWATFASYGLALFLMVRGARTLLPEMAWPRSMGRLITLVVASSVVALLFRPFATGVIAALSLGLLSVIAVGLLALALSLIRREDLEHFNFARQF